MEIFSLFITRGRPSTSHWLILKPNKRLSHLQRSLAESNLPCSLRGCTKTMGILSLWMEGRSKGKQILPGELRTQSGKGDPNQNSLSLTFLTKHRSYSFYCFTSLCTKIEILTIKNSMVRQQKNQTTRLKNEEKT